MHRHIGVVVGIGVEKHLLLLAGTPLKANPDSGPDPEYGARF